MSNIRDAVVQTLDLADYTVNSDWLAGYLVGGNIAPDQVTAVRLIAAVVFGYRLPDDYRGDAIRIRGTVLEATARRLVAEFKHSGADVLAVKARGLSHKDSAFIGDLWPMMVDLGVFCTFDTRKD